MSKNTRLIVVDVSNFIFRAFYAVRPLSAPDGTPVNAVHGILSMFLKMFSTYRPTHIFLARDTSGGSFRNELYDQYKANRSAPPEDLIPQFDLIKRLIEEMGLRNCANEKYEADDIIGSAVTQWKDHFDEILIASGDKDLMQFVGGNIKMLDTMKDIKYSEKEVFDKMGVRPDQIVDYLSMVGDASDNIPGMRGIGAKGAAKLLAEHETLEKCIEVSDTFKGKKLTTAFTEHVEDALLSKKLIQIVTDIELGLSPEETQKEFYPDESLIGFLKELGFNTMIKRMEDLKYQMAQAQQMEGEQGEEVQSIYSHEVVDNEEKYNSLIDQIKSSQSFAIQSEFDSEDIMARNLIGMSFSFDDKSSSYVELNDKNFDGGKSTKEELDLRDFYKRLLNFTISSDALIGDYADIHQYNREKTLNYGDKILSFVRWSENEKLLVISNFDDKDHHRFVLEIPSKIINKWNLKEGNYDLEDALYQKENFSLNVNESKGFITIKLKPLQSFILKLK